MGPDSVQLPIPDRSQGPGAPRSGWCGESAIQQALLYYGAYLPQAAVNRAGSPAHADLYAQDIPVALRKLGVRFRWAEHPDALPRFYAWLRAELRAGRPVFAGVKIHPTEHPEWSLDHFVLLSGYDARGFVFNTTWGKRQHRTIAQLSSTTRRGLAFANRTGRAFALAVDGGAPWAGATPTRLHVLRESATHLEVVVMCEGLRRGDRYEVVRAGRLAAGRGQTAASFVASGARFGFRERLDASEPAIYRCVRSGR